MQKWNENDEIVRHKARLVAQEFIQRPNIDFREIYSHVVNTSTFRYLVSYEILDLHRMDVATNFCIIILIVIVI